MRIYLKLCSLITVLGLSRVALSQRFFQPTFSVNFTLNGFLNAQGGYNECEQVALQVVSVDGVTSPSVVPPLYMITVETNGAATTENLGSDLSNISWTIKHTRGTLIYYYLVDSDENMSKVFSTNVYNGTTDCLPSPSTSAFTVTVDRSQVNYCDYLTMNISGGTKPYEVTAFGSDVTNYTLNVEDDVFNFVNNIGSGFFLILASDADGRWSTGQNYINSVGSNSSSCSAQSFGTHSLDTNSSSSSTGPSPSSAITSPASSAKHSTNVGAIAGGTIGGVVFLSLCLSFLFLCLRRDTKTGRKGQGPSNASYDPTIMNQYRQFNAGTFNTVNSSNHMHNQGTSTPDHLMAPSSVSYSSPTTVLAAMPSSISGGSFNQPQADPPIVPPRMLPEVYSVQPTDTTSLSYLTQNVVYPGAPTSSLRSHTETNENEGAYSRVSTVNTSAKAGSVVRNVVQRAPVQHQDADDVLGLPPAYRDRSAVA